MHPLSTRARWASALALPALLVLSACSKTAPAPEPVRAVRTVVVGEGSAQGQREYAGEVRARIESRLGFRVGGKLVQRQVEVGQTVAAGQALAQLDLGDLKLSQDAAQAQLRAAQTNFDLAQADFRRYKDLFAQGFIGAAELERRDTTLKAAKATLDQAQAQAQVQGNQAGYGTLTAPTAGVVVGIEAEVGTVLAAGTPVVRLAHDGPRDAVFSVPEDQYAALVALKGKAGALSVQAWGGGAPLKATVREVGAAADAATRTFLVKASLGDARLALGQTLTVGVDGPVRDNAIRLPLTAVSQQQGQTSVWVLDRGSMTVKPQPVQVGGADGNTVLVQGGLNKGQWVVTAGVHTLAPGQKVKLYEVPASAPQR